MDAPSHAELYDEIGVTLVQREVEDGWRHGCDIKAVYHRPSDDTYWLANYRLSTDGETNELCEEMCPITRVEPREVTTTVYVVAETR